MLYNETKYTKFNSANAEFDKARPDGFMKFVGLCYIVVVLEWEPFRALTPPDHILAEGGDGGIAKQLFTLHSHFHSVCEEQYPTMRCYL